MLTSPENVKHNITVNDYFVGKGLVSWNPP